MKLRGLRKKATALTFVEVLFVVGIIALLAAIFLPALAAAKRKTSKIGCANCLKQIGLSFRIWSGDNGDKYPMEVSVTNGGAMELALTGDATAVFQVMSNELSAPKILCCPNDTSHSFATNFGSSLCNTNISYFVGLNAAINSPQALLSGDDNFQIGGVSIKSGLLKISPTTSVKWTGERHKFSGYIGFADGSVQSLSNPRLSELLQQTGLATNCLAIP